MHLEEKHIENGKEEIFEETIGNNFPKPMVGIKSQIQHYQNSARVKV
jgi:hypothetical protein